MKRNHKILAVGACGSENAVSVLQACQVVDRASKALRTQHWDRLHEPALFSGRA